MKKIYIQKNDLSPTVVNKLLSTHEREVIIYVPKDSVLLNDPKSFRLIKREAAALKKKITIESVSSEILDAASNAGLAVSDAVFGRRKNRFVDIVPSGRKGNIELHIMSGRELCDGVEIDKTNVSDARVAVEEREDVIRDEVDYISSERDENRPKRKGASLLRAVSKYSISLAVFLGVFYIGLFILPKATVELKLKEFSWSWKGSVSGDVATASASSSPALMPIQVFKTTKSGVFRYPASGSEMVENKASGKITIFNAYSSDSQPLVKNTRFVTPGGKIFRLTSSIVVPGAKIAEGKIIPSSIEAPVVADAAGDSYNTGPVPKLRIPGFQGGPKYDGFYGELKEGASGGFIGVMKVVTTKDLDKAKKESRKIVEEGIFTEIAASLPDGFVTVSGGEFLSVSREGVTADPDESGEFSYGISIEAKVIAFREEDIVSIVDSEFEKERGGSPYDPRSTEISYGAPIIDWNKGRMTLPVEVSGIWTTSFDPEKFKAEIIGKNHLDFRRAALSIQGTESVKSALWPFWIRSVPKNSDKIDIVVN